MTTTVEYASYVIDLTDAMLSHRRGLNLQQIDHLETINRRAVDFVTTFLMHDKADLDSLFKYLNQDAIQPISVIAGYSEFMLMGGAGEMLPAYRDALEEICDCAYSLRNELQSMLEELIEFMDSIGYEHGTQVQEAQPILPKEEETQPARKPIQALPKREEETQAPRNPIQALPKREEETQPAKKPIQALPKREEETQPAKKPIQALPKRDDATQPNRPAALQAKAPTNPIRRIDPQQR